MDAPTESFEDQPSEELQRLLANSEEITWYAKPMKNAMYWITAIQSLLIAGFLFLLCGGLVVPLLSLVGSVLRKAIGLTGAIVICIGMIILLLSVIVVTVIRNTHRRYTQAEYAVTDEQLIQFDGLPGRDYSSISWDRVRDLEVNVGLLDKLFGTGTIRAHIPGGKTTGPGGTGISFKYIQDPHHALNMIEDASPRSTKV